MDLLNVVLDPEKVKSPASDNVSLTKKQRDTLDKLRAGKINEIKTKRELSAVLNTAFNNDMSKETKKLIVKSYNTWLLNQPKPPKSIAEANKKVRESISKKSTSKKSRKEMMNEESEIFNEIKEQLAPPKEEEEKHDDDDKPKSTSRAPAPAPAPVPTPAQDETARLQAEALQKIAEQGQPTPTPDDKDDDRMFGAIRDYIDVGGDYYNKNKKTIDKVLGAFTKKKLEDGSYLTELASLEFPEIKTFQEAIKIVGLGFTDEDKRMYEDMLSTSEKRRNSVSPEDKLRLTFKQLLNPDQLGVLVKKGGEALVQEAKDWWEKVTTGREALSVDDKETQQKIDERRKKIQEDKNKKSQIDSWFGIDDKPTLPDDTRPIIDMGGDKDGIHGGGAAYNPNLPFVPVDENLIDSYSIFLPPDYKDFQNTPEGRSILDIMRNSSAIGTGIKTAGLDKMEALTMFKLKDPEGYAKYQEAMNKYNKKIGKAGLDRDNNIDYEVSKEYIDNSKAFTEDLIKKAVDSGDIDRTKAEALYEYWKASDKIINKEGELSYGDYESSMQEIFKLLPRSVITENSDMINKYMADNKDFISANWEGDSDLGNFDWLQKVLDGEQVEDIDIKEKKIKPDDKKRPKTEPKYRYRAKWGNEDELFERSAEEIEKRNLVIEVQRLREDVETTNKLIQSRLMTEDMRFSNTFAMPPAPEYRNKGALPNRFKQEHRAIFNPVYAPAMREPERNMRDEASYQQYKNWYPRVPETTARVDLLKDALIYPSNADMATGGEELYVAPPKDFNYIQNLRFTRR